MFAVLVLDAGVTLTHFASHRWGALWRYHAEHHGVQRMHGLNGLMKHLLQQLIDGAGGIMPLVCSAFPPTVASAVVFCARHLLLAGPGRRTTLVTPCFDLRDRFTTSS